MDVDEILMMKHSRFRVNPPIAATIDVNHRKLV